MLNMERKSYIGSSDAKDIALGLYGKFYQKKISGEEEDLSDNFKVQFGAFVEPFHLDWIIKHQHPGWTWSQNQPSEIGTIADTPYKKKGAQHFATAEFETPLGHTAVFGSHPDALMEVEDGSVYPAEVKHTGTFKTLEEAQYFYAAQLQHHMICWRSDRIFFSVIVGNEEPVNGWVGKSYEYENWYLKRALKAWDFVAERHAPPVDGPVMEAPAEIMSTIPIDGMKTRYIEETNNIAMDLLAYYNRGKIAQEEFKQVKDEMKDLMADDEKAVILKDRFEIKRDKKGNKRIYIKDAEYGVSDD